MTVKLIAVSSPKNIPNIETANDFIAYTARVSNPNNQANTKTAPKLLRYLIRESHWSPFEMVHVTMEIKTTRDIGRQIIRHRSFSFQEFSQRYAEATDFDFREARLQDTKNRQNSIDLDLTDPENRELGKLWQEKQTNVIKAAQEAYQWALSNDIAKEQARAVLPEGNTETTMYMSGTLRSWIHYCDLRRGNGTQKEHMVIANDAWEALREEFPDVIAAVEG